MWRQLFDSRVAACFQLGAGWLAGCLCCTPGKGAEAAPSDCSYTFNASPSFIWVQGLWNLVSSHIPAVCLWEVIICLYTSLNSLPGMKSCSYLRLFTSAQLIVVFASQKQLSSIIQHNPFYGRVSLFIPTTLSSYHNPDWKCTRLHYASLLWGYSDWV